MIKSYWFRILFCGIAVAILGFLLAEVTPPQYDAEMQIKLAPYVPTISGAQDEVDATVRDILQSAAPRSVQTQVDMLTSFGVLEKAAAKVASDKGLSYINPGDELNPNELRDKISIEAARDSDIVGLKIRMPNLELGEAIVSEMYSAFEDENRSESTDSAERAIAFLQSQNKDIQGQLD